MATAFANSQSPTWAELRRDPGLLLAFGFGSGLSPWAPGTAGSLVALLLFPLLAILPPLGHGHGLERLMHQIAIRRAAEVLLKEEDLVLNMAEAAEGFVALAPDLYGGKTTHDAAEAGELMSALPMDQAARDLAGAVDFLLADEGVTSSAVGAVGFCMGGGFVLMMAAQQGDRIGAAVPFYGVGPAAQQDFTGLTAAVQGHYGERDDFYPVDQARAQEQQIREQSGADVTFHYYDAAHAFHNDENLLGTYSAADATLAWSRTVEFLREHLS